MLPEGWRWESYHDVVVGVPGEWGYDNSSQRINQWCVDGERKPAVGRPGWNTAVGCPAPAPGTPSPGTLASDNGQFVGFGTSGSAAVVPAEGDRVTLALGAVTVAVQTLSPLRERIVATIHRSDTDPNECPTDAAVSRDPALRPGTATPAEALRNVSSISACKYEIANRPGGPAGAGPTFTSSIRLIGTPAEEVIRSLAAAPAGGGPDDPTSCSPEVSFGEEIIVLHIASATGSSQLYVRYSGCDHNGVDDGTTVRRLTAAVMKPITSGSNLVQGLYSADKGDLCNFRPLD